MCLFSYRRWVMGQPLPGIQGPRVETQKMANAADHPGAKQATALEESGFLAIYERGTIIIICTLYVWHNLLHDAAFRGSRRGARRICTHGAEYMYVCIDIVWAKMHMASSRTLGERRRSSSVLGRRILLYRWEYAVASNSTEQNIPARPSI